jgi:intermediate filament protein if
MECASDGSFIILENNHLSKEEYIGGWKLERKLDGQREIVYTLPGDYVLKPGKTVKVGT